MMDEETARKFEFLPRGTPGYPGQPGGDFMSQLKSMGVMGDNGVPDVSTHNADGQTTRPAKQDQTSNF